MLKIPSSWLLIHCILLLVSPRLGVGQDTNANEGTPIERTWTSKAGTPVKALLVNQTRDSVELLIPGQQSTTTILNRRLSAEDQKYLELRWYNTQDSQQYELLINNMPLLHENARAACDSLTKLHTEFPDSPYAGLWAAVALGSGSNEHQKAVSLLYNVIRRIEKQQELDPKRHRMTLCSANNNLAVCYIKGRKGDSAAAKLISAAEDTDVVSAIVVSNLLMLSELASKETSAIQFSNSTQSRLSQAIGEMTQPSITGERKDGWYYMLDFELSFRPDSPTLTSVDRLQIKDHWCIACDGKGFLDCPVRGCSKGVVSGRQTIQTGTNPMNGRAIYGQVITKNRCTECGGRGGKECPHCNDGRY